MEFLLPHGQLGAMAVPDILHSRDRLGAIFTSQDGGPSTFLTSRVSKKTVDVRLLLA